MAAPRPPAPQKSAGPAVALAVLAGVVLLGGAAGAAVILRKGDAPARASLTTPPRLPTTLDALPRPAPEPEVPASASFTLHSRVSGYKTSFYVLGFVKNTSPFVIDKPKITAVLLDGAGKEVVTRDGYAEADSVAPGGVVPVKLLVNEPPAHERMTFEVVVRKASYIAEPAPGLRLEIAGPPRPTFGKSWEVTGKAFNDGKAAARFVKISVQAFDANDKLVGLDTTYADGQTLAAGASARFRAMPLYDAPPHHFRYELRGQLAK